MGLDVLEDPQQPWLCDYHAYIAIIDILKQIPEGWTVIQWWGIIILVLMSWQETNIIL